MNIHKVFDLGLSLYQAYNEQYGDKDRRFINQNGGVIKLAETANPEALRRYREAFVFYVAFEHSGHSYIAAYLTRSNYVQADSVFENAIKTCAGARDTERYASFVQELDIGFHRELLNRQSPFLFLGSSNNYPSLASPAMRPISFSQVDDLMPYSFFIEVMTCKEMKVFAVLLILSGLIALTLGIGGLLNVAVAASALKAVGVSAMTATVGGTVSAAIGAAILLYKPKPTERKLSRLATATMDFQGGSDDYDGAEEDGHDATKGPLTAAGMALMRRL